MTRRYSPEEKASAVRASGAVDRDRRRHSYDNALAETVRVLQGRTCPRTSPAGPVTTVENLELTTLGWVHWHNTRRLHGYPGDVPPAEFENAFYADQADRKLPVEIK